ncbi:hypothetical protein COO60DRAFT_1505640, partial [Scenedesmus sp. NREL 46B-D3]
MLSGAAAAPPGPMPLPVLLLWPSVAPTGCAILPAASNCCCSMGNSCEAAIGCRVLSHALPAMPPVPAVYRLRRETESPGFTSTVSLEPVERSSWLCGLKLSSHAVIQHPEANIM